MIYNIWCPERGGTENESLEIVASNMYAAAEEWARQEDEADVGIADHEQTRLVRVRVGGSHIVRELFVSGEVQRVYSARLKVGGEA